MLSALRGKHVEGSVAAGACAASFDPLFYRNLMLVFN
jgi:hypothetical protein